MRIRPIILCGGSGSRLWPNNKNTQAKQFINFGNWTLFGKALERIKNPLFDIPVISTNLKYLKEIKQNLKKHKINKYKIILEPVKRNTGPAMLCAALIKDIPEEQALIFFSADHLLEKENIFYQEIKKQKKKTIEYKYFYFWYKTYYSIK